ncbi:MAG: DNA-3-methyladenine glycosylase family protein [Solirubrobacterales bacterium]
MLSADEYLRRADPVMMRLIDARGPISPEIDRRASRPDPFLALARAIVGQQISTKAAASIWAKFEAAFDGTVVPEVVVEAEEELLRGAGLSRSKVAYLRDLAGHVTDGRLDLTAIAELSDEDVIANLIEVKGIGRWTGEMFLIFHLGRPDVLSTGDLGIRRAVELAYGLGELPGPTDLERIAEPWRPQRTLACLYLWRSLDNAPD